MYSLGLLLFGTSCFIFRREKVCQTSFQVHFCVSFQPTTTLLHMFIGLVTCCFQLLYFQKRNCLSNLFPGLLLYQFPTPNYLVRYIRWPCYVLLPVVTSLAEKRFVKLVYRFTSVLVSNPQLPCYIYSLGLIRFVTSCYIFRREKVCQTSFQVHFCVSFQPTTTLLHMFIGLVTCCFQLLYFQKRNCLSNLFPGLLLYQFQIPNYLVTYIRWPCYVLLRVVTSLAEKRFVKLVSRFTFVLVSNQRLPCYICSLGLLRVVSSCYIFRREIVCQTCFQVYFCISFQLPTTLLRIFAGLITFCYLLLHLQKRKGLSNQFQGSLLYQLSTHDYLATYVHWACYVLTTLLSSSYIFRREKFCQTSFQVYFCISFQPTTTLLHMFIGLDTCCFQLLHLYKGKFLSNYFPGPFFINFHPQTTLLHIRVVTSCYIFTREKVCQTSFQVLFLLISIPKLPCYIYSQGLLRFVTSCYIFRREKVCQTSFQVHFCISFQPRLPCYKCSLGLLRVVSSCYIFIREKVCQTSFQVNFCIHIQPPNTLLHIFAGLVTFFYQLLYNQKEKRFVKLISRFTSVFASNRRLPCYICSLGLLRVVSSCYIFIREKVCQTSFQVNFCIHFQPPNTLLHIFAGLVTFFYQLLYNQKRKGL